MQQGHPTTNSREHVLDRDIGLPPLDKTSARSEKGYVGFYATLSKNLNDKNNVQTHRMLSTFDADEYFSRADIIPQQLRVKQLFWMTSPLPTNMSCDSGSVYVGNLATPSQNQMVSVDTFPTKKSSSVL